MEIDLTPEDLTPEDLTPEDVTPKELSLEDVVRGYCLGAFPMARSRTGAIDWFRPDPRAIMPLDERFHVRRSLRKRVRNGPFTITRDRAFQRVMRQCAKRRPGRQETWISDSLIRVYTGLHHAGLAHSIEAWVDNEVDHGVEGVEGVDGVDAVEEADELEADVAADAQDNDRGRRGSSGDESAGLAGHTLVGGLYGVALGAAFFGESMFSRQRDASQVCLVHLVEHLRRCGYVLLDVQYPNPHLEQFGILEIPCDDYLARLNVALQQQVHWDSPAEPPGASGLRG